MWNISDAGPVAVYTVFSLWHQSPDFINVSRQENEQIANSITGRWDTLRHTETHWDTLRHTETHWDTLRHIETHLDTLRHTKTHWDTLSPHGPPAVWRCDRSGCSAVCGYTGEPTPHTYCSLFWMRLLWAVSEERRCVSILHWLYCYKIDEYCWRLQRVLVW